MGESMGGFLLHAPSAPLLSALRCHHYKRPAQDSFQPSLPRGPYTRSVVAAQRALWCILGGRPWKMWSPGCRGLFEGSLPASSGSMGTMEDGWLAAHHPLCWSSQALCNLPLLRLMTNPESGSIMVAGGWTHSPVTSAVHLDCTPSCRRF